jgi:type II secretory pathway component PulF
MMLTENCSLFKRIIIGCAYNYKGRIMALYSYQALSREGKRVSGQVDASSVAQARELIVRKSLYPTDIVLMEQTALQGWSWQNLFVRSISSKDKIFFTKQLAVLLKSGTPLLQSLELLIEQTEGRLRSITIELKDDIKEGRSLADGLSKYPKVFDTTYIQLVRAGEASGRLEVILDRLTEFLERRQLISNKVRSALRGPLINLAIIGVVVMVLLSYVVPTIAQTFTSQGAVLPGPTRFLLGLSYVIRKYYWLYGGVIVGLFFLYRAWRKTSRGARIIDSFKLKIPIVRYFARMGAVVQFSRTLGMLIEGGVNLAESLQIVVTIIDNRVLVDALQEARENIIKQGNIAEYLKQTGIFPSVAIYLINTGEQTGQLDVMLLTVAHYYEGELTEAADSLSAKIGPLMMMLTACIVGFIVLSIMLPLVKMNEIIGL